MSGMTRCDWTHPAEATMISKYFGRQGREWATAYTCLGSWMCKTWRLYEVFYWSARMPEYWPCSDLNTRRTWRCHHKRCGWLDEICRPWFAASWISLSPDSDQILLFCRWESEKAVYQDFLHKNFPDRARKSYIVHFITYCIKKTKWHTQFRDLIHTFICLERRRIMKKAKLDVISWRRNISFMCKCGGEKKTDNDNEEILFRRGWKKGEGRGNIIWMRIFLAEETKKREGKRGSMRDNSKNFK